MPGSHIDTNESEYLISLSTIKGLPDINNETTQVMENLKAILAESSLTFDNVVKTTIFLSSMDNFSSVNEIYGSYLDKDTAPARETVEVSKLPAGVNVEISMIATL